MATGNEIVELARKTYVDQFAVFVRKLSAEPGGGLPEAIVEAPPPTRLYERVYRADFARTDGDQTAVREFRPDGYVTFDLLEGQAGAMRVRMDQLCWDDVEITHDLSQDITPVLKVWFDQWFDPNNARLEANRDKQIDVIHSVRVYPNKLVADFGTASTQAYWSLIARLRDAGATSLLIRETRQREAKP